MLKPFEREDLKDFLRNELIDQEARLEAKGAAHKYAAALRAEGASNAIYNVALQLGISLCEGAKIQEGYLDRK